MREKKIERKKKEDIFECEKDALSLNTTLTTNTHIQCLRETVCPSISSHLLLLLLSNIPLYIPFLILHYVSISLQFFLFFSLMMWEVKNVKQQSHDGFTRTITLQHVLSYQGLLFWFAQINQTFTQNWRHHIYTSNICQKLVSSFKFVLTNRNTVGRLNRQKKKKFSSSKQGRKWPLFVF